VLMSIMTSGSPRDMPPEPTFIAMARSSNRSG
jgi:hypothetical protein